MSVKSIPSAVILEVAQWLGGEDYEENASSYRSKARTFLLKALKQEKVVSAAQALAEKLDEIMEHPSWNAVFLTAKNRGVNYDGPTFEEELKELKEQLK